MPVWAEAVAWWAACGAVALWQLAWCRARARARRMGPLVPTHISAWVPVVRWQDLAAVDWPVPCSETHWAAVERYLRREG